jgi:hypothetical protein
MCIKLRSYTNVFDTPIHILTFTARPVQKDLAA